MFDQTYKSHDENELVFSSRETEVVTELETPLAPSLGDNENPMDRGIEDETDWFDTYENYSEDL